MEVARCSDLLLFYLLKNRKYTIKFVDIKLLVHNIPIPLINLFLIKVIINPLGLTAKLLGLSKYKILYKYKIFFNIRLYYFIIKYCLYYFLYYLKGFNIILAKYFDYFT